MNTLNVRLPSRLTLSSIDSWLWRVNSSLMNFRWWGECTRHRLHGGRGWWAMSPSNWGSHCCNRVYTQQSGLFNMISPRVITISLPYWSYKILTHALSSSKRRVRVCSPWDIWSFCTAKGELPYEEYVPGIEELHVLKKEAPKFTKFTKSCCATSTSMPIPPDWGMELSNRCHRRITCFKSWETRQVCWPHHSSFDDD